MAKGWKGVEEVPRRLDGREWVFGCPKPNCYYAVSFHSEDDARKAEAEHPCPYQGGITKIAGSVTLLVIEDMWNIADKQLAKLENEPSDANRGMLNGMCVMLALWMRPHFSTAAEVGKELTKRRGYAKAGEEYTTPGLGNRRYEMPKLKDVPLPTIAEGDRVIDVRTKHTGTVKRIHETDGITVEFDRKFGGGFGTNLTLADLDKYYEEPIPRGMPHTGAGSTKAAAASKAKTFTAEELAGMKFAHESGAFTLEQIAATYGATIGQVKTVLGVA